ncbi:MAG: hypothetical protein A2427_02255 [Candidatus Nealsonbacteria bacterium RIFOXYC1_FULL_40_7]|uniref:site-specific DNA-methyltransferase (adenine-specific) n=2 Tax=Patescibacteria group TaxID=1783273 RepID=A0A1G2EQV2_9BACT|nr:MAG: hypothetical protein A2363_02865 [Candidatus Gottesmanbacteria bacterium RIFOXYB1_FULL_47_11]OGZ28139.1 MAG: hypothetical protein A2427_02255 [Candidatus Nealsonbacteria bacterium RIFOXYC1_FULL_40_7]
MSRITKQELQSIIGQICNKLWAAGLTNPITYIEQISYLFFLKMLEEWDNSNTKDAKLRGEGKFKSIFEGANEKYRWSVWTHIPDNTQMFKFLRDDVFPFMANIPGTNENVRRFFVDARFQIPDGVVLRDVIDKLRDISFIELDADVKGDLYEFLLNQIESSAKLGAFRTPRHIIRTIVQLTNPQIGESVLDPACGTGGFLLGAYEWIKVNNSDTSNIEEYTNGNGQKVRKGPGDKLTPTQWQFLQSKALYGFDVDASMVKIATMNLILHGLEKSQVIRRDSIAGSPDEWEDREFDVIISNPPFAGTINKERIRKNLPVIATDTTILFLGLMIDSLRQGGRAGIVVNEGVLFNRNNAAKELRRYLLDKRNLLAVISLPGGVFQPYSGVKTSILLFNNDGKKTEKVWFYDVRYDGLELSSQRRPSPDKNDLPHLLANWNDKPDTDRSWSATRSQIEENDFILSASAYRPITEDETKHREPKDIFAEIKELNNQSQEQLKKIEEFIAT